MLTHLEAVLWLAAGCIAAISYLVYSSKQQAQSIILDITFVESSHARKVAFHATRLTASTFLIKEYDDIWAEHPHIYAKVVPAANAILIIDTGCGGRTNDSTIEIKSLREFIETVGVPSNGGKPLNPNRTMEYIVALTHCHYDHILGVEDFAVDSPILASSHMPGFIRKENLAQNSQCASMGLDVPDYNPVLVHNQYLITSHAPDKQSLGVTILHTPGHTPDEIALFDETEMMLYVGDTLYEWEHIIFPSAGSIVTWFGSINHLVSLVKEKNAMLAARDDPTKPAEVLINAGHVTVLRPALNVLLATVAFMKDVVEGREEVKERFMKRGVLTVRYEQADGRFSLICPERLVTEAHQYQLEESMYAD